MTNAVSKLLHMHNPNLVLFPDHMHRKNTSDQLPILFSFKCILFNSMLDIIEDYIPHCVPTGDMNTERVILVPSCRPSCSIFQEATILHGSRRRGRPGNIHRVSGRKVDIGGRGQHSNIYALKLKSRFLTT